MKNALFLLLLLIGSLPLKSQSEIAVKPIHYKKWIQKYEASVREKEFTSFTEIPIAFFMDTLYGKVKRYEKLEIGINLPEEAKKQIANFIKSGRGINPFDPEQLRITAQFQHVSIDKSFTQKQGDTTISITEREAFYYEEFNSIYADDRFKHGYWKKDTTSYNFRIRFAPDKEGEWTCVIKIYSNNQLQYTLKKFTFLCVPNNTDGFITGISTNKRLLQFENGKNFFGIGQNIPIADMPHAIVPKGLGQTREQPPQGFHLQREYIADLASNGGNLVRIMHGEWADALEWEKLNDYSMNMNFAWEFDQTVNLCHEKNIYILWLQQVHTAFMARNPYNNDALAWPMNPYHVYLKLEKPEDFFSSEEALKMYKRKIRYMLSRWGYSRMICGIQPMSEINEMAANITDSPAHHPYFTDTSFRSVVGKWFLEIKNYIQKDLGYPFLIGSSFTGDLGNFVGEDIILKNADFNDYHPYAQNRNRNIGARFGGINCVPGYGVFKRHQKPVILGEIGIWDTEFLQECHENEFHNDLWATAFMGGWAGGLHWHNWEDNFKKDLRKNFLGLHNFLKNVDFDQIEWKPMVFPEKNINDSIYSENRKDYFENLYMVGKQNSGKNNRAFGWVHNRSFYWYNLPETDCEKEKSNFKSKENKGKKFFRPADDDQNDFEKYEGKKNKKKRMTVVKGLQNLKTFHIDWIDTRTGFTVLTTTEFHGFGKFKMEIPDQINQQEYQDLGYKIYTGKCFTQYCVNVNF